MIITPNFVLFVSFVVKKSFTFGCGFVALASSRAGSPRQGYSRAYSGRKNSISDEKKIFRVKEFLIKAAMRMLVSSTSLIEPLSSSGDEAQFSRLAR